MHITEEIKMYAPSEFRDLEGIEYFQFEEDFVEANIRCIPMIVRFKMDMTGIKLKLSEWSKFKVEERIELALLPCNEEKERQQYNNYLRALIKKYTGGEATVLEINKYPEWANTHMVTGTLSARLKKFGCELSAGKWRSLSELQRFALLKLMKEGHENKNFPKAIKEFGLNQ